MKQFSIFTDTMKVGFIFEFGGNRILINLGSKIPFLARSKGEVCLALSLSPGLRLKAADFSHLQTNKLSLKAPSEMVDRCLLKPK